MTDYITIRSGDFTATLDLRELHRLPITKWRKLLKLAAGQLWDNAQGIQTAMDALTARVSEATEAWGAASREYVDGWRDVSFIHAENARREAKKKNQALTRAVTSAKTKKEDWEKRLSAITEAIPTDQLEYWLTNY